MKQKTAAAKAQLDQKQADYNQALSALNDAKARQNAQIQREALQRQVAQEQQRLQRNSQGGYRIVNGQVVDQNGILVPGWTVVNGQAVKLSTNQASQQRLPQTSSNTGLTGVLAGIVGLISMFGLLGTRKKRNM